jgi:hypothetical protein
MVSKKDYTSAYKIFKRIATSNKKPKDCLEKFEIFKKIEKKDAESEFDQTDTNANQVCWIINVCFDRI